MTPEQDYAEPMTKLYANYTKLDIRLRDKKPKEESRKILAEMMGCLVKVHAYLSGK